MIEERLVLVFCHMIGDYVLQSDFIARTKGENWWHMIVHCTMYVLPFYLVIGHDWRIAALWAHHFLVDTMKARWKFIGYAEDQIFNFAMLMSMGI